MKIQPNNPIPATPKPLRTSSMSEEKRLEATAREESRLRDMFGDRFFGSEEWARHLNAPLSREQLANTPRFPWSNAYLNQPCPFTPGKRVRDTHMVFLGIDRAQGSPLTLQRLFMLRGSQYQLQPLFQNHFRPEDILRFQNELFFSRDRLQHRWYLAPLDIPTYYSLTPKCYAQSSAIEEATKLFLYYAKHGKPPHGGTSFTSSKNSLNEMISVSIRDGIMWVRSNPQYTLRYIAGTPALSNMFPQ